jgi:hypothetical protein
LAGHNWLAMPECGALGSAILAHADSRPHSASGRLLCRDFAHLRICVPVPDRGGGLVDRHTQSAR